MLIINENLTTQVKLFLESGDRSFLTTLQSMDRNSIEGQAVVRYLLQLKHWPFTPESEFSSTLNHLFGHYVDRPAVEAQEYKLTTADLIRNSFNYECVEVIPEPRPEPKSNPGKVTRRPKMVKESETEGGVGYESTGDLDTTHASSRLKKVIGIQRGA